MVQATLQTTTLRSQIHGQVITPQDANYEQERLGWNRLVNQYPALIVIPASTADVCAAVRFAGESGLQVAVQSTGHGVTRPADGALLLVTAQLKNLRIDADAQTAWLGAGLKWGEVLEQAQQVGLAPLLGSSPGVSVVGYTLGGGYGWLGRKYGLAVDSVLAIELVDASGQVLTVSQDAHPDLFWGLCGGGSSFGVVTALQMRLYPVTEVYAGNLFYPPEMAGEVMQHYREWTAAAPDELTSSIVLMNFPPFPQVPEPVRGKSFVIVRGAYTGDMTAGEQLLRHWRDWRPPLMDMWGPLPFSQAARISNDPVDPMPSKHTGAWLHDMSDATIARLIRYTFVQGGPPPLVFIELRHFGGAVRRVPADENAFSNREAEFLLFSSAVTPSPEAYADVSAYMTEMKAAIAPSLTGGEYLNFLEGAEARQKVDHAFGAEKFARLQALKAKFDPAGRFISGYRF
jgi:FAD/FMN-containing dehydrogenase